MAESTISIFLKNIEAIKASDVAKGVTIVNNKQRPQIMDEVVKLLLIWIREQELDGDNISEGIICEKALHIYSDLLNETPNTSAEGESWFTFKASRGWFENLKHQSGIHSAVRHGEAASSNKEAAKNNVCEFRDFVNAGGYLPQQMCNCDGTDLFLKKMPNRTYITKEEKSMPGHKPMMDRITILVCVHFLNKSDFLNELCPTPEVPLYIYIQWHKVFMFYNSWFHIYTLENKKYFFERNKNQQTEKKSSHKRTGIISESFNKNKNLRNWLDTLK